jgi:ankyrin repeat protein
VNAADAQGQTPLMLAAAFGSPEALRLLITGGADVRAASATGVTALHLGATSLAKAQLLVDAGADVNAVSSLGRTPLIVAASASGNAGVVRLLLQRGAGVNVADTTGITPLIAASVSDNLEAAELLLARGADPKVRADVGQAATPLHGAATNGNVTLLRRLLAKQVDVNAVSADASGKVKNGLVQFGRASALHFAALSGNPDAVGQLLAAGASVDALDVRGMTPLMFAIATDRPDLRIIRTLLDAGASPNVKSKADESAIDWALKFNNPAVLDALKLHRAAIAAPAMAVIGPAAAHVQLGREAVGRSIPSLQATSAKMLSHGGCVACHAQPLSGIAVELARTRSWTSATADAESSQAVTQVNANMPPLLQLRDGGGLPDGLVYVAWLMTVHGAPPSRSTDALAHYVAAKQRSNGSWDGIGGSRAPMQDGNFSRTALAIRTLTAYGTPARATEYENRVHRAAVYLEGQQPLSTEDRVMQLLGLRWAGRATRALEARTKQLLALQRPDGGWGQTPYLLSDAYATGQALFAVGALRDPASEAAVQRGVSFLLRTQHGDGSWHVKNRAMKIQPYFDSGCPYEHDQWISAAGTAWATMGLSVAADDAPGSTTRR